MDKVVNGRLLAATAAVSRGMISILVRGSATAALVRNPVSSLVGNVIALVAGILSYLPVLWWQGRLQRGSIIRFIRGEPRGIFFYSLAGMANSLAIIFWYASLSYAPAAVTAPIEGTHRLFTLLLAYLFMQRLERINWRIALGILVTVLGTALVVTGRS